MAVRTAVAHDCLTSPVADAQEQRRMDEEILNCFFFPFLLSLFVRCG